MNLHYDIRDVFRAVRMGWSGKKIWIGLVGLFLAWAGYSVFVLLAHGLAGASMSALWHRYGLFPGARFVQFGVLGSVLHLLGMIWAVAVAMVATSMMCKVAFQHLRGDDFYSSGDAWKFAKGHGSAALFGPIAVLALFAVFSVTGIVIGWVAGWIPVAGELVFALSFIPIFMAALVAVFIGLVFCVSAIMAPAIVGSVGEDALEVVIQSFSLTWAQPWRLVLYVAWLLVGVWVGIVLLGTFTMSALWLITWACGLFMDVKLANLLDVASRYLPFTPRRWDMVLSNLPAPGALSGAERWGGRILGGMLIVITGIVLVYAQAVYASGLSLIYVILRKRKDGENLLAWESEDAQGEPQAGETGGENAEVKSDSDDAKSS